MPVDRDASCKERAVVDERHGAAEVVRVGEGKLPDAQVVAFETDVEAAIARRVPRGDRGTAGHRIANADRHAKIQAWQRLTIDGRVNRLNDARIARTALVQLVVRIVVRKHPVPGDLAEEISFLRDEARSERCEPGEFELHAVLSGVLRVLVGSRVQHEVADVRNAHEFWLRRSPGNVRDREVATGWRQSVRLPLELIVGGDGYVGCDLQLA